MHEGFHIRDWKVITMVIMVMTRTMMTMMIFFTDLFLSRTVLFFSLVDAFITMPLLMRLFWMYLDFARNQAGKC